MARLTQSAVARGFACAGRHGACRRPDRDRLDDDGGRREGRPRARPAPALDGPESARRSRPTRDRDRPLRGPGRRRRRSPPRRGPRRPRRRPRPHDGAAPDRQAGARSHGPGAASRATLSPRWANARTDDDRLIARRLRPLAGRIPTAEMHLRRPGRRLTVALVGDSHAAHWFPAFDVVAKRHGWRLVPFTKFSCVFVDLPIWSPIPQSRIHRVRGVARERRRPARELKPDLVVIASDRWFPVIADRDDDPERQGAAMARLIDRIPGSVAIMVDTPRSDSTFLPASPCTVTRSSAARLPVPPRSAGDIGAARRRPPSSPARPSWTCPTSIVPGRSCPPIIGKTLVYRDHHHLTATFVVSLARRPLRGAADTVRFALRPRTARRLAAAAAWSLALRRFVACDPGCRPAPVRGCLRREPPFAASRSPRPRHRRLPSGSPFPRRSVAVRPSRGRRRPRIGVSLIPKSVDDRAWEPIVATHPTDPDTVAVVYQHRGPGTACGSIRRSASRTMAASRGDRPGRVRRRLRSRREPPRLDRVGPGPGRSSRLYWANMTTPGCGDGRFSPSTPTATTRAPRGRSSASSVKRRRGLVASRRSRSIGPCQPELRHGLRRLQLARSRVRTARDSASWPRRTSARTWRRRRSPPAPSRAASATGGGSATASARRPDGSVYASWYQVDMRRWDRTHIFAKGGPANVGRLGVAVARVEFDRRQERSRRAVPDRGDGSRDVVHDGGCQRGRHGRQHPSGPDVAPWLRRRSGHRPPVPRCCCVRAGRPTALREARSGSATATIVAPRGRSRGCHWPPRSAAIASPASDRISSPAPAMSLVTFHTLDDVRAGATIGNEYTVSTDGGATWRAPAPVSTNVARTNIGGVINGIGLRERAERLADGDVFWAYGDGRYATGSKAGRVAIVGALIRVDRQRSSGSRRRAIDTERARTRLWQWSSHATSWKRSRDARLIRSPECFAGV